MNISCCSACAAAVRPAVGRLVVAVIHTVAIDVLAVTREGHAFLVS